MDWKERAENIDQFRAAIEANSAEHELRKQKEIEAAETARNNRWKNEMVARDSLYLAQAILNLDPTLNTDCLNQTRLNQSLLVNQDNVYEKLIEINEQIWEGRGWVLAFDQRQSFTYGTVWENGPRNEHFGNGGMVERIARSGHKLESASGYRLVYARLLEPDRDTIFVSQLYVDGSVHDRLGELYRGYSSNSPVGSPCFIHNVLSQKQCERKASIPDGYKFSNE